MPQISICIPAYKRSHLLQQLLGSIDMQTFRDFEVIVTDDSPDDSVARVCENFSSKFSLHYYKNQPALGTPENWNEAVRHAKGQWIKIMHDDDWFDSSTSLQSFVNLAMANPSANFIFSGSVIYENGKKIDEFEISGFSEKLLDKDPANLFYKNFIGPPSVSFYRNYPTPQYDRRMKWLVDVDFYIHYIRQHKTIAFTKEKLIRVGFNPEQVTKAVFHDSATVIPETLLLLDKIGTGIFYSIWNFDSAWRLMRNYHLKRMDQLVVLARKGHSQKIPQAFVHILKCQRWIPAGLLKIGLFSKLLMFFSYIAFKINPRVDY